MSGKKKFLRYAWISGFCLSFTGFAALVLFFEKTTWVDAEGFLYEPLFWLIPTSYAFLGVSILLAFWDKVILPLWDKISSAQKK